MVAPRGSEKQQFIGGATTGFMVTSIASVVLDRLDAADGWQAVVILTQLAIAVAVALRFPSWRTYALAATAWPLAACAIWGGLGLVLLARS